MEHLQGCSDYGRKDARIKTRAQLAAVLAESNARISTRRKVREQLTRDERFGVTDEVDDWVCPYCKKAQKAIHMYPLTESAVFEKTVEQVVLLVARGRQ